MIIKNGRFGKFAACPNYPACKNTKALAKDGKSEKKETEPPKLITDKTCEICSSPLVLRTGRYGTFYACSRFPECNYTLAKDEKLGVKCPVCGDGDVLIRRGKKRIFYSCEKYPKCDFSSWDAPSEQRCPKCNNNLYVKKAKNQLVCKTEGCGFKKEDNK